jgi:hypothetical protein
MFALALSQLFLNLLSMILGACGIFCLVMSFAVPGLGADALLMLSTASAIVYFCSPGRTPGQ